MHSFMSATAIYNSIVLIVLFIILFIIEVIYHVAASSKSFCLEVEKCVLHKAGVLWWRRLTINEFSLLCCSDWRPVESSLWPQLL